jgi:hypothetical protein
VNLSTGDVADVPLGVVTVTSTVPVPAGETAEIDVGELTMNDVAAVVPNVTAVAPVNPLPAMETGVPPASDPELGLMPVTLRP